MYNYTCELCKNPFQHRKKNKKYCSTICAFKSRHNEEILKICSECHCEFKVPYRLREQKFCSKPCFAADYGRQIKQNIELICKYCKKTYTTTKYQAEVAQRQHCSRECMKLDNRNGVGDNIEFICQNEKCGKAFDVSFYRRNDGKRFCSRECFAEWHSGENNYFTGKPGHFLGKKAWNNGLTTETSEKLVALGEKVSATQRQQFIDGKRSNKGENNPNYGKTPDQRTPEQHERYSKAAIKRVKDGFVKPGFAKTGVYCSSKTTLTINYKSSYEERTSICFDKDLYIKTWLYEPFYIMYLNEETGRNCRYLIDFLIEFIDGTKKIIETKAEYMVNTNEVKYKKQAAEAYCKHNNMIYEIWTAKEISEYEQKLGITSMEENQNEQTDICEGGNPEISNIISG
jgi:hypothetical protein